MTKMSGARYLIIQKKCKNIKLGFEVSKKINELVQKNIHEAAKKNKDLQIKLDNLKDSNQSFKKLGLKRVDKLIISGKCVRRTFNEMTRKGMELVLDNYTGDSDCWIFGLNAEGEEIARFNTKFAEQIFWLDENKYRKKKIKKT